MVNVEELGWDVSAVGELDHQKLTAPHVKLRSAIEGAKGDVVYSVDLRIVKPNTGVIPITEMHSFEHFLLAGFRKYMPDNFISIGLMGCQTGFYLILLNEGSAEKICAVYEKILNDILTATEVPYTRISDCGNYHNHSLELSQELAGQILAAKSTWRQVI
jgi:S-ribosylhomocysteine lyase